MRGAAIRPGARNSDAGIDADSSERAAGRSSAARASTPTRASRRSARSRRRCVPDRTARSTTPALRARSRRTLRCSAWSTKKSTWCAYSSITVGQANRPVSSSPPSSHTCPGVERDVPYAPTWTVTWLLHDVPVERAGARARRAPARAGGSCRRRRRSPRRRRARCRAAGGRAGRGQGRRTRRGIVPLSSARQASAGIHAPALRPTRSASSPSPVSGMAPAQAGGRSTANWSVISSSRVRKR